MGLFGGFKAKFTKDSTAKTSKSVKKDEVVCLGYRVYSEFDNPPQYLQTSPEPSKPPPPIRTVASRPKSTTSIANTGEPIATLQPSKPTSIETQIKTKSPKIKKSSKKKAPQTEKTHASTANLTSSNSTEELSNSSSMQQGMSISSPNIAYAVTTETVKLRNGRVREESGSATNSMYARGKTSSFNPTTVPSSNNTNDSSDIVIEEIRSKPPKSILKQKSYTENLNSQVILTPSNPESNTILTKDEHIYSDTDYDRSMSLTSSKKNKSKGFTTETVDYISASKAVTKSTSTEVATYVHTEVSSGSGKTESSINDNSGPYYSGGYASYSTTTRSIGSTSNHAASIFFGGDEEPEVQRPRRANLAVVQSEEDRRSSAEC